MVCYDCKATHEQLEGEKGKWICWKTDRTICETPASSCGDVLAHVKALQAAQTPDWCPLNNGRSKTRPRA